MKIVLDTHILLKAAEGSLAEARVSLLGAKENQLFVSAISLWEITKLFEHGRISLDDGLKTFLTQIAQHPRYQVLTLTPEILATTVEIAEKMHKDPSDQIIVATALSLNAHLMTDDRPIRKSGLVEFL